MVSEDTKMGRDLENLAEWKKKNIWQYNFSLNYSADKEVIEHLEKIDNKKQYLIRLIREDMRRENGIREDKENAQGH